MLLILCKSISFNFTKTRMIWYILGFFLGVWITPNLQSELDSRKKKYKKNSKKKSILIGAKHCIILTKWFDLSMSKANFPGQNAAINILFIEYHVFVHSAVMRGLLLMGCINAPVPKIFCQRNFSIIWYSPWFDMFCVIMFETCICDIYVLYMCVIWIWRYVYELENIFRKVW